MREVVEAGMMTADQDSTLEHLCTTHTQLSHVTSNSKGRREFPHYASHTNKERELHKMAKIVVHAQQSLMSVYDRLKGCENRLHDGYDPHQSGCFQEVTSKVKPQLWIHVQFAHVYVWATNIHHFRSC